MSDFDIESVVSSDTEDLQASYNEWLKLYTQRSCNKGCWRIRHLPGTGSIEIRPWWDTERHGISGFLRGLLTPFAIFPRTKCKFFRDVISDAEAVRNDWVMVGWDLHKALEKYSKISSPSVRSEHSCADASEEWTSTVR